jgi:hypothetical protein
MFQRKLPPPPFILLEKWRQHIPPKLWYLPSKLHYTASYKNCNNNNNVDYYDLQDEMLRVCSRNGGEEIAYRILVGNPEGKKPLRRPRYRCVFMIWIGFINVFFTLIRNYNRLQ